MPLDRAQVPDRHRPCLALPTSVASNAPHGRQQGPTVPPFQRDHSAAGVCCSSGPKAARRPPSPDARTHDAPLVAEHCDFLRGTDPKWTISQSEHYGSILRSFFCFELDKKASSRQCVQVCCSKQGNNTCANDYCSEYVFSVIAAERSHVGG